MDAGSACLAGEQEEEMVDILQVGMPTQAEQPADGQAVVLTAMWMLPGRGAVQGVGS
eukprot:SAG22_NODE_4897_length_1137_cov_29.131985_2_plen_57_part_00